MRLFEGRKDASLPTFLARRARRDLQFSNIFYVDLVASAFYVAATLYLARSADVPLAQTPAFIALATLYVWLHLAKIGFIVDLERRGGDPRQFMSSDSLVTSGVYAYSRNPVYVVSIVQSLLWSILLVCLAADQSAGVGYVLAPLLLYGHFRGMDRLIIPYEEEALRRAHPQEFAAYAGRVRRWLGRKG